ncbi:MAG: hypothetical protein HY899_00525 [Deltaproteobacteria bacterium]|nr:hypothetical protein [Deltaproteobacteria bacterium]
MFFSANVRSSHTGFHSNRWEAMRPPPKDVPPVGRILVLIAIASAVLATAIFESGLVRTLGSERRTARGIVEESSTSGYGTGLYAFPLLAGQGVWFEYDATIANGVLNISFLATLASGKQADSRSVRESGNGRLEFQAEHSGIYHVNLRPTCGYSRDCSVKYSVSWGLL